MPEFISEKRIADVIDIVYDCIRSACTSQSATPSYSDIMAYCAKHGKQLNSNGIPAVLKRLEDNGLIERVGIRNLMVYRLPSGETSARRPQMPHEKPLRGPSLEARAKMWGVPVKLSHPSDRHLIFDRRLMPPPGSLVGVSYTVI